jgi:hypothetical protein
LCLPCIGAESAPLHILDEQVERAADDGRVVSARNGVAQQIARELEFGFELGIRREGDLVTPGGERLDGSRSR